MLVKVWVPPNREPFTRGIDAEKGSNAWTSRTAWVSQTDDRGAAMSSAVMERIQNMSDINSQPVTPQPPQNVQPQPPAVEVPPQQVAATVQVAAQPQPAVMPQQAAGGGSVAPQPQQVNVTIATPPHPVIYPVSDRDRTLRLVAFIFMLISLIATCWLIIPLAWMIPMTVISWRIYKGQKANTTAFGVCSLIFCSIVAGILLLISTKDI